MEEGKRKNLIIFFVLEKKFFFFVLFCWGYADGKSRELLFDYITKVPSTWRVYYYVINPVGSKSHDTRTSQTFKHTRTSSLYFILKLNVPKYLPLKRWTVLLNLQTVIVVVVVVVVVTTTMLFPARYTRALKSSLTPFVGPR